MRPQVLVADDELLVRKALSKIIEPLGCDVTPVNDGRQALAAIERGSFQLVVTDLRMPEADGMQVVRAAVARGMPVIVLTGFGSVNTAVDAMREGATDFLTKPFEVQPVERVVRAALQAGARGQKTPSGRPISSRPASGTMRLEVGRPVEHHLIGESGAMAEVRAFIARTAPSDKAVLITGESGTGKEVVAHLLHQNSGREGLFIAVNCAALPEHLLESELFGHLRGSFTGATQARTGRFALAAGGTIFLDEIAEMAPGLQAKLLRVLQDKEVTPVGASRAQRVDVRIVAATNRDLEELVQADRFRQDLYYRLCVFPIHLPPLRERAEDIPALCAHFLARAYAQREQPVPALQEVLSAAAIERLKAHPFPGNVRELENLMERVASLRRDGQILGPLDLPLEGPRRARSGRLGGDAVAIGDGTRALPEEGVDLRDHLNTEKRNLIMQALSKSGGNKKVAAELLRVKRTTLVMMMRGLGMDEE